MTAQIINFSKTPSKQNKILLIDSFVAQKLKKQRGKLNLSLEDLAYQSKISSEDLKLFENGKKRAGVKNLLILSNILTVDFSYFFKELKN